MDSDDRHHEACLELLEAHPGPLLVPTLVITEVAYLLQIRLGVQAEVKFLADLAEGNLIAEPVLARDWLRIAELVVQYRDFPLGTADASVIAAAERLGVSKWRRWTVAISAPCVPHTGRSRSCRDRSGTPTRSTIRQF